MELVQTVSQYVRLRKQGANWMGVCPWCEADMMSVSPARQIFYCFGCNKGGTANVFIRDCPIPLDNVVEFPKT